MSTIGQKRAALRTKEAIEKQESISGGEILEFSGFSEAIQKNPQVVFNSPGFKKALEDLGFSLTAADLTVAKVLRTGRDESQLNAAKEIYKRLGGYAPERSVNLNLNRTDETKPDINLEELTSKVAEELKKQKA